MNSAKSSATTMLAVLTMRWIVSGKRASGTTRKTRPFYKNTFAHHTNMSEKRKIVLDTNCLIASLSRRGQYFHLIEEDHDDDKFVDCAFAANATFIVSDDKHYDVLQDIDFPKLLLLKLKYFLDLLQSEDNHNV